jgi:hypothetical protein
MTRGVLAFEGSDGDVAFLRSLLDASGITCAIDSPVRGRNGVRDARLYVAREDVEAAAPLIADFNARRDQPTS